MPLLIKKKISNQLSHTLRHKKKKGKSTQNKQKKEIKIRAEIIEIEKQINSREKSEAGSLRSIKVINL